MKFLLQKRGERDASRVHSGGVNAALVTDDASLAVTLSKDCTARVWDLRTGTCMHVLVGESPRLLSVLLLPPHQNCPSLYNCMTIICACGLLSWLLPACIESVHLLCKCTVGTVRV